MTMVTWAGMMLSRAGLVICQPTTSTTFAVLSSVVKLSPDFLHTAGRFADAIYTFDNMVFDTIGTAKTLLCSV